MTVKVTFYHLRILRHCTSGIRRFCDKYDIPMSDFREGVDVARLRDTGDAFAMEAIKLAEQMGNDHNTDDPLILENVEPVERVKHGR